MAYLAAALPYISAASTVVGAGLAIQQGRNQKLLAAAQANELAQQANAEKAAAEREALQERKKANFLQSRVQAVAAASGAGASDPTVANIQADIQQQSDYAFLTSLYGGDSSARGLNAEAASRRAAGRAAQTGGYIDAASTILTGATDFYTKYGKPYKKKGSGIDFGLDQGTSMSDWSTGYAAPA